MEKINSKCLLFKDDAENFKGPDGTLLCFKTDLFKEIARDRGQLPDDGREEKHVSNHVYGSSVYLFNRKQKEIKSILLISLKVDLWNFEIDNNFYLSMKESVS